MMPPIFFLQQSIEKRIQKGQSSSLTPEKNSKECVHDKKNKPPRSKKSKKKEGKMGVDPGEKRGCQVTKERDPYASPEDVTP